jgi:predicted ribonuclease YlaK
MSNTSDKKTFVLDTNVLMHDPACLFRFKEHDLFIPMIVLEELDQSKKGVSDSIFKFFAVDTMSKLCSARGGNLRRAVT